MNLTLLCISFLYLSIWKLPQPDITARGQKYHNLLVDLCAFTHKETMSFMNIYKGKK